MSVSERKYKIIEQLLKVEEEETLYQIESLLNKFSDDKWDILPEELKDLLETGLKQCEEGKFTSHTQVMAEIKQKYNLT
ncbi:MAG: hypothetical protein ACI7YS_05165 [Flavobacterium sp.]